MYPNTSHNIVDMNNRKNFDNKWLFGSKNCNEQ